MNSTYLNQRDLVVPWLAEDNLEWPVCCRCLYAYQEGCLKSFFAGDKKMKLTHTRTPPRGTGVSAHACSRFRHVTFRGVAYI